MEMSVGPVLGNGLQRWVNRVSMTRRVLRDCCELRFPAPRRAVSRAARAVAARRDRGPPRVPESSGPGGGTIMSLIDSHDGGESSRAPPAAISPTCTTAHPARHRRRVDIPEIAGRAWDPAVEPSSGSHPGILKDPLGAWRSSIFTQCCVMFFYPDPGRVVPARGPDGTRPGSPRGASTGCLRAARGRRTVSRTSTCRAGPASAIFHPPRAGPEGRQSTPTGWKGIER